MYICQSCIPTAWLAFGVLYMQQSLNVPKQLLRCYADTKRRKELFAFAVWLKMAHESSVAWNVNSKTLRYQLHIGKVKAERIYADARENTELFTFYEYKNSVKANSFRDKTDKTNRRGQTYHSDTCYKFPIKKDYKLREIYDLINEFLATDPINAQERNDCLSCRVRRNGANSSTLTLKQISCCTRMSKSSTHRIMKRLKSKDIVDKKPSKVFCAANLNEAEDIRSSLQRAGRKAFSFIRNGLGYIITPCSYSIKSREWSNRFQHVIYDYKRKRTPVFESTIPQLCGY